MFKRDGVSSTITSSTFRKNKSKSGGNAFTLIFCDIDVTGTTFDSNMAFIQSSNIFAIYSEMNFNGNFFLNTSPEIMNN